MSRRSSAVEKIAEVPASVLRGLTSFVADHAEDVATMLDCEAENEEVLVKKLRQVMGVNSLSAEVSDWLHQAYHALISPSSACLRLLTLVGDVGEVLFTRNPFTALPGAARAERERGRSCSGCKDR